MDKHNKFNIKIVVLLYIVEIIQFLKLRILDIKLAILNNRLLQILTNYIILFLENNYPNIRE